VNEKREVSVLIDIVLSSIKEKKQQNNNNI